MEHLALTFQKIEPLRIRPLDQMRIVVRSIFEQRKLSNAMQQSRRISVIRGEVLAALLREKRGRNAMPPPFAHERSRPPRQSAPQRRRDRHLTEPPRAQPRNGFEQRTDPQPSSVESGVRQPQDFARENRIERNQPGDFLEGRALIGEYREQPHGYRRKRRKPRQKPAIDAVQSGHGFGGQYSPQSPYRRKTSVFEAFTGNDERITSERSCGSGADTSLCSPVWRDNRCKSPAGPKPG